MVQYTALHSAVAVSNVAAVADGSAIISCRATTPCKDPLSAFGQMYLQAAGEVSRLGLQIMHERVFAPADLLAGLKIQRQKAMASRGISDEGPLTCIHGQSHEAAPGGIQLRVGPASCRIEPVELDGAVTGRTWRQDGAVWVMLQNMHGLDANAGADNSRQAQVQRMIQRVQKLLCGRGGSYRHVVRTWIYIDDILDWYGPFNTARNAEYGRIGIMPDGSSDPLLLPASTGIGGANPFGAACLMDVLAIIPDQPGAIEILRMTNSRQKEAFKYGSAFSRGTVIGGKGASEIYISGTAAIDENGISLHRGDTRRQVETTLDVVDGLLGQAGASLADIADATFFFKHAADIPLLGEALARRELAIPGVTVVADVCRDELLFELDCMALTDKS
ncbi:MAG: Rid family hydrolase [Planctomycetaceae bacterium]|nr:hypothetical protein [Planctomycetaceae bacterium]